MDLLIRFLLWLCRNTPSKVYTGRDTSTPYLTRYFLTKASARTEGMEDAPAPKWGLYLHHFHRGDEDRDLHDHPWKWAVSLVLKGGYLEERRIIETYRGIPAYRGFQTSKKAYRPGHFNYLTSKDYHRVELLDPRGSWTLFLVGPVTKSWGFWNKGTGEHIPWKRYLGLT